MRVRAEGEGRNRVWNDLNGVAVGVLTRNKGPMRKMFLTRNKGPMRKIKIPELATIHGAVFDPSNFCETMKDLVLSCLALLCLA